MSSAPSINLTEIALCLSVASGKVNNYCDHAEHLEVLDQSWVTEPAKVLRDIAVRAAAELDEDAQQLYATRLAVIEERNVHYVNDVSFNGLFAALEADDWRDLQIVQTKHDRVYHPDVNGLTRYEQLRHYAFHIAKLAGGFAELALTEEDPTQRLKQRLLPDTLLFGLKLSTVMSEKLPAAAVSS